MMLAAALQMSLTFFIAATANSEEQTLFLERGYQGIVACNPNASREYTFDDLEGVYWYFSQYDRDHFIFSYFQGDLYEGEDIPKGMYNISNDFSLIIQNVTDSDEGTYYYKVEPLLGRIYQGSVEVAVKVTPKQPFPVVPGCDPRPLVTADSCIAHEPYDIQTVSLTCQLNHAKPPVDLQWLRVFDDGHTEHIEATLSTKLLVNKPGLFFIDDTYTSLSSFHLSPTSDNITRYRCEAYGVALGDRNGSHVSVTVSKDAFPSHADWKAFLDRGRRGIVPYSPDAAWAHQRGDLQGVYWYFRQRDREHVIFSYFQGATVPLDGIPEGMYNVTSNFSLIIQNVTDSHEGTYHYVVESKVGQIDKGSVEVVITVTAPQPFPVVPGCDPRPSGPDTCMLQVPYDTMTVNLTCQVDHAKPPVDLQWFRVFHNGYTEHVESTTTTTMLVYTPGSSFDNTYVSSSMFHLSPTSNDSMVYRCDAYGVALGDKNGSHVLVTVSRDQLSIDTGTTQETASSSPPKNVQTALIVLVVIFGLLSLFFNIILLIPRIRYRLLPTKKDATEDIEMSVAPTNVETDSDEISPFHAQNIEMSVAPTNVETDSDEISPLLAQNIEMSVAPTNVETDSELSAPDQPQWKRLAGELGFTSDRIAYFKSYRPDEPVEKILLMLFEWRAEGSSPRDQTTKLCEALAAIGRKDLAYELQELTDKKFHKISKDLCEAWEDLAYEIGLVEEDVDEIKNKKSDSQDRAFKMLKTWRALQSTKEDCHGVLCRALDKIDKKDLANRLRKGKNSFIDGRRRLQRVGHMLTLESDSKTLISEEFEQPSDMIIYNQEDLRSLRDDVRETGESRDEQVHVHVETLHVRCTSREDVDLLREIIQSTNIAISNLLHLYYLLSKNWKEELESLVATFQPERKFQTLILELYWPYKDDAEFDMGFVGKCVYEITRYFPGKMGLSLQNMIRSCRDVTSLVDTLKGCEFLVFGCPEAYLHGHVGLLAPLITSCLQELRLYGSNLTDDDVTDLIGILPKAHPLRRLNIHGNKLSLNGISGITSHLTLFPQLILLDVCDMGLDAAQVKEVVEKNLPLLKETKTGIFEAKYWI